MVRLTLLDSQHRTPVKQWTLPVQPLIKVGRSADNHVVLSDILVSRYHLELVALPKPQRPPQWRLNSLGTNGTFLNGKLVAQAIVSHGSLIQLGPSGPILRFESVLEPTLRSTPEPTPAQPESADSAPSVEQLIAVQVDPSLDVLPDPPSLEPLAPEVEEPTEPCSHPGNQPGNLFCIHCGQPLKIQKTIRSYQVLQTLGHGGMGTTYLVRQLEKPPGQAQLQVLKEMNAAMAEVPKAQELFEREARILQSLNHPGIPRFYNYFLEHNKKYLVMELIHGQDLDKWVLQQGPVPPAQAITWMLQACDVLSYLHSQTPPVLHRDLKPSNMLVRAQDNRVVIIDFGAVKEVSELPGTRIAVEGYSAPEQNLGRPQISSDLYAIGATLIFLLLGQSPLKIYKNTGRGYRFQLDEVPQIPVALKAVIRRLTKANPEDRYQSAADLALALRACL